MEPVSLSVSVVALATVFDSALNCFKHVKVAKSFGSDYQIRVLRLQNLQLHLPRCGETVGLRKDPTAHEQSAASPLPETQLKRAELRRTCWPHHPTLLRRRRTGEQIRRRARRLGPHRRKLPKSGRHREALREDARHLPATPAADKGCEEGQVVAVLEGGTSSILLTTSKSPSMISRTCSLPRPESAKKRICASKGRARCATRRPCPNSNRLHSRKTLGWRTRSASSCRT
jgi:hypothetical protein